MKHFRLTIFRYQTNCCCLHSNCRLPHVDLPSYYIPNSTCSWIYWAHLSTTCPPLNHFVLGHLVHLALAISVTNQHSVGTNYINSLPQLGRSVLSSVHPCVRSFHLISQSDLPNIISAVGERSTTENGDDAVLLAEHEMWSSVSVSSDFGMPSVCF